MDKIYAGIGSRTAPESILSKIMLMGKELANSGFTLRSGGAVGCDYAFEKGCDEAHGYKEIYLPWKNFNGNSSPVFLPWNINNVYIDMIRKVNPSILSMSRAVIALHARNCQQILGQFLDSPSNFVVCWTNRDRTWFGGTMFAIRLAELNHVPVINMIDKNWEEKLRLVLENKI